MPLSDYGPVLGLDFTSLDPGIRVLELGCGQHGLFSKQLEQEVPGIEVISLSPHLRHAGASRIPRGIAALAQALPFRDNTFDLIVSHQAIPKFLRREDLVPTIDEITRILKPGGEARLWPAAVERSYGINRVIISNVRLEYVGDDIASQLPDDRTHRRLVITR